jgi:GAF domain-containing protein
MSLTRKASPKKPTKPPRQGLAAALAEREAELVEARHENARLLREVQARARDQQESLEQQTAAAEILRVISSSPADLQPVFDAIARSAVELCAADKSGVFQVKDGLVRYAGYANLTAEQQALALQSFPAPLDRGTASGRAILSRDVVHIRDIASDPEYSAASIVKAGFRSALSVPMLRNSEPIGAINVTRLEPRPFSDRQIELLKTFADQAVIAIENARLVRETNEALERQTATAEVLKVIAGSPSDMQPVFDAILEACQRLFGSDEIGVYTIGDDDMVRVAAWRGPRAEEVRRDVTPLAESVTGRIIKERRTHHIPDLRAEPNLSPLVRERVERLGSASLLYAPMLWEDRGLGSILVARSPPRPFSDREQALLQTFADQAAIAIENARLFNQTQEALGQQIATSDILKVIASSPGDLQPVLDRLVETTCRLFGANDALLFLREGGDLRIAAHHGPIPIPARFVRRPISRDWVTGRAVVDCEPIHVHDLAAAADEYPLGLSLSKDAAAAAPGLAWRTVLATPLMREAEAVGVIVLRRTEVLPFTEAQIALLQTFADQAVIAIENTRLFNETQEALERQTGTAEVLKVISRSAFDLNLATSTILEAAARLCCAPLATLHLRDGEVCRLVTQFGLPQVFERRARENPIPVRYPLHSRRPARAGEVAHFQDAWNDPDYLYKTTAQLAGYRAIVVVPLMRDGELVGIFSLGRPEPEPFTPSQIKLVQTFADQAAIAIQNAQMFDEVQARTRDLTESLRQQTATADVLKVISRSAFDLQTVLDTLVSSAVDLSGAFSGAIVVRDGDVFRYRGGAGPGYSEALQRYLASQEIRPGQGTIAARALLSGHIEEIADIRDDPEYTVPLAAFGNISRALLGVPLLGKDRAEGALTLTLREPGRFTPRQIELVQTFADQAVIAIENARLFDEVQARTRDLSEALQQQTATAEVLKVISRSAFDLQAVWRTLVESASTLCDAPMGLIELLDGDVFRMAMQKGYGEAFERFLLENPLRAGSSSGTGRAASTGEVSHIPDVLEDPDYLLGEAQRLGGYRSNLAVPLLRENKVIGVFVLCRPTPGPFTERQIELVKTFADQAVIAIENVRLFDEVQARTRDLSEALAQQIATADVLKAISRSAFDLKAVLGVLVQSVLDLCSASGGNIHLRDGETFPLEMQLGWPAQFVQYVRDHPVTAGTASVAGRAILTRAVAHIPDVLEDHDYGLSEGQKIAGYRALLSVPLLRSDEVIGAFSVGRPTPGPFSQREIELVQTFADQAVIAIENVRLFDEVQARTRDLQESLARQTATADVLKVISRSAFDVQAVLDALLASAVQLSGVRGGAIALREGEGLRVRAEFGRDPGYRREMLGRPISVSRGSVSGRVVLSGDVEQIPDVRLDKDFDLPTDGSFARLGVPLVRNRQVEGVIVLVRDEPGPFSSQIVELVKTFADQAVIAIENTSLFNEVQARTRDLSEALQQQTATADVLKVISRSAFDLQAVLNTLVRSAMELTDANVGVIYLQESDAFHLKAHFGMSAEFVRYLEQNPQRPGRGSGGARVLLTGEVQNIADAQADEDYDPVLKATAPSRGLLGVPLMRNQNIVGAIVLSRTRVGVFTQRQIEMVQTFADQAVIAIENARLFGEVQARTQELAASLDDLRKAQDRLIQSEKLASLGQLTAGIAHEIKNPLNFVNNFSALSRELVGELAGVIKAAPLDDARREEADELIATIGGNLDKVVQHGKRADSIVKNMLLHSREGSGERSTTNVNAMVEEALNLAYHGARAEKPGFNVTMVKSLDPGAGDAEVYAQEMTRVLLNLISNGFYATTKRRQADADRAYEPTLTATTRDLGKSVEIIIRDNGTGIPDEVRDKMFNPFFTTKPAGEGTGLGLSLSHDIVVKQHGGTLEVSTEPGAYTEFTIVLPRAGVGK